MDAKQLAFIKKVQKEFQEKFNFKLEIDWPTMAGNSPEKKVEQKRIYHFCVAFDKDLVEKTLQEVCDEVGANVNTLKNKRCTFQTTPKEIIALKKFSKIVMSKHWNVSECGRIINKHRSVFYHHANE